MKEYYELIEKYGEKNVITAFRTLLVNSKNDDSKMRILQKYSYAYITIDIENLVIDKNSYKKLCNKYGEDNVDKYIIEYEEIGTNAKISDNISKILDFLVKDEEEKEDYNPVFEDELNLTQELNFSYNDSNFKNSEFISPGYGILEKKSTEVYTPQDLEKTIELDELEEEIRKTEEFLKELKKLKSRLID